MEQKALLCREAARPAGGRNERKKIAGMCVFPGWHFASSRLLRPKAASRVNGESLGMAPLHSVRETFVTMGTRREQAIDFARDIASPNETNGKSLAKPVAIFGTKSAGTESGAFRVISRPMGCFLRPVSGFAGDFGGHTLGFPGQPSTDPPCALTHVAETSAKRDKTR